MLLALSVIFSLAVGASTGWWLRGKLDRNQREFLAFFNDHTPMSPTEAACMGRPWTGDDDTSGPILTGDDECVS